jgi:cysteine desulfurase
MRENVMRQVYLDNQANTRIDDRVFDALLPYLKEHYGNAQSMHSLGMVSKEAVEAARQQVADLIGATADEIYFTSSGSEANNLAIKGVAEAQRKKGKHIVVSAIEHFSVLNAAKRLAQAGFEVTQVPVDRYGMVAPDDVRKALRDDTILVSIQHANTEIGTVQPVAEIAKAVKTKGILFHTDAVATAGTIPVDVKAIGADLLSLSGSQFYGPKGGAALYIRKGVRVVPQIDGGVQENGRRAGTENVPAIVGLGAASALAKSELSDNARRLSALRDRLLQELPGHIEHIYLNGHPTQRLPGNANFSVEFIEGEGMFLLLDAKGIMVSSGSACANKALKMSHVLSAINVDPAVGQGSILMSLSKYTTAEDINYVLTEFPPIVRKLRDLSPLYAYFQKTGKRQVAGPGTDYEHEHGHEHENEN